jgi:hypothetical protein
LRRLNPGYWVDEYWGGHGADAQAEAEVRLSNYYFDIMANQADNTLGLSKTPLVAVILGLVADQSHTAVYGVDLGGKEVDFSGRLIAASSTVLSSCGTRVAARSAKKLTFCQSLVGQRKLPKGYSSEAMDIARAIIDKDRYTPITSDQLRSILSNPELSRMSSSIGNLRKLFPDVDDDMLVSMNLAFHGSAPKVVFPHLH